MWRLPWQARGKLVEYRLFLGSSDRLKCRFNKYWFILILFSEQTLIHIFLFTLSSALVTLSPPKQERSVVSKAQLCCLTIFYWRLRPRSVFYELIQRLLRPGSGVEGPDAGWWLSSGGHRWSHITASSMQHYSLNEASFNLPVHDFSLSSSSPLTARGGLQWIPHLRF